LILTAAATCYPSVEMVEETRMVEGREGENTSSLEQSPPRVIETEPPLPGHSDEPPKGMFAMGVAILWAVLAFAFGFEAVVNINDWLRPAGGTPDAILAGVDLVLCFALGILAVILWKARDWLPKQVADSAIAVSTNPSAWVAVALVILIISALPQLLQPQKASPTADEIANAVVRAMPSATSGANEQTLSLVQAQLREVQAQRDQALREQDSTNQRLAALGAVMPNPLHSDAVKWKLTSDLAYVSHDGGIKKCKIIINKDSTQYSETYTQDLKDILNVVNWQFDEMVSDYPLPRGMSITAVNQELAQGCAQMFSQRLSSDVKWHGAPLAVQVRWAMSNNIPSHLFSCGGGCIEIGIGDDPEQ
jgi:hypothetical protein